MGACNVDPAVEDADPRSTDPRYRPGTMTRAPAMTADDRREQLLAAARRVFAEKGYHNAGVSDVIREAGVARGTFYNYFDSKRSVFHAVLVRLTDDLYGSVTPIDVGKPIPAQARANLKAVLTAALQPDVTRLVFAEAVGVDADGDEALREFYRAAEQRIVRALELGQSVGVVREADLSVLARCLLGMAKEQVFLAGLLGDEMDVDAVVDEIFALITRGFVTLPGALDG